MGMKYNLWPHAKPKNYIEKVYFEYRENSLNNPTMHESFVYECFLKEFKHSEFHREFWFKNRRFDFYFPKIKTAIEIDGGYHNTEKQKYKDQESDKFVFTKYGIKTIRIKNEDVKTKIEAVIKQLKESLKNSSQNNLSKKEKRIKHTLDQMVAKNKSLEISRLRKIYKNQKRFILRKKVSQTESNDPLVKT